MIPVSDHQLGTDHIVTIVTPNDHKDPLDGSLDDDESTVLVVESEMEGE